MRCMLVLVNVNVGPFSGLPSLLDADSGGVYVKRWLKVKKFCSLGMVVVVAFLRIVLTHGRVHVVGGNIGRGAC